MLSRILHRQKTPELTLSDKIRKMSTPLKEKRKTSLRYEDVDVLMSILNTLDEQSDGAFKKEMLLQHLAFDNMNTSYIEPYIEAAFKQQHPEKRKLADTYHQFIQGKNTGVLVSKLLDDRFYNIETFPVYSFLLLGKAGAQVSDNQKDTWLFRALASQTPIDHIQAAATALSLDVHTIKDKYGQNILHRCMKDYGLENTQLLSHLLTRAKEIGIKSEPDIFGRHPEEFGSLKNRLLYAEHYESAHIPKVNALVKYLNDTVHNSRGVNMINSVNSEIYVTSPDPLNAFKKITLFEHVLDSNDYDVVTQQYLLTMNALKLPEHIDQSFGYIFLEHCAKPTSDKAVNQKLFDWLQQTNPQELSTALGYFLMRSDAYYKNYEVNAQHLVKEYQPQIENIMAFQQAAGLTPLLEIETKRLEEIKSLIAPPSSELDNHLTM